MTGIRLVCGDCMQVMHRVVTESVDLVLCDLPYGTTSNKWDSVLPLDLLWAEYLRIAKRTAAFVFTASQPFTSQLVMSQIALFRHEWIWVKNAGSNFANTGREPMKEHETVLVFSRGGWVYNRQMQERAESGKSRIKTPVRFETKSENYRDFKSRAPKQMTDLRVPSSVQRFNRERGLHPTQKPLDLMCYLVETYSNPGDKVLDPCMGSGTVGVACKKLGRRFVGIEKDAGYFQTAKDRIENTVEGK